MGFYKEIDAILGGGEAAAFEAEECIRMYGHASAGPEIKDAWAAFAKVRGEMRRYFGSHLPEDVASRLYDLWQRVSDLD